MGTKTTTAAANNEKLKTMIHMRGGEVVGRAVMRKLSEVKANSWNPNKMDDAMMESLKFGLINDGWLASQALLIWHTDEKGKTQDVIIDGEHRWSAASEIGFVKGPMVMLDGLTEAKAKALTIKMNQKRGEFQKDSLAELMSSLQTELDVSTMGIELGFSDDMVMKLLASQAFEQEEEKKPRTPPEMSRGLSEHA
jgi:hypothetical protein